MDNGQIITIALFALGIIVGIIGFFLKRTINQIDKLDKKVGDLEQNIGDVKTNYLTKEDFFREQAKTDRKLDEITKYLMQIMRCIKGGAQDE